MYSVIAFLLVLGEWALIGAGYATESFALVRTLLLHGSPVSLIMYMLTPDSVLSNYRGVFGILLVFHLMKYFFFFQAKINEELSKVLALGVVLEICYLALSGYLLFSGK